MTIIFSDGFETGFTPWSSTTGGPSTDATHIHHGVLSAKFSTAADMWAQQNLSGYSTVYLRAYVYFDNLPSTGNSMETLVLWNSAFTPYVSAGLRNNGGVYEWGIVTDAFTDSHYYATGNPPKIDTWFCMELMLNIVLGVSHNWELWVDGTSLGTHSHAIASATINRAIVAGMTKAEAITNYADCVVVSDAYIGPELKKITTHVRVH